jgi:electron transport complex protein RnfD
MAKLVVSSSPHIKSPATTQGIMLDVIIALLPTTIAGIIIFGWGALLNVVVTVAAAVISEYLFNLIAKKKQTIGDLSAVVTGLLLALNVSTAVPAWQCAIGAVFAIVVVKCAFGGIGANFANPAITARVFMLVSFGSLATNAYPTIVDLKASATPLVTLGEGKTVDLLNLLIGLRGGAIGEVCTLALLAGGIYLLWRRVISWHAPVGFIATVFVLTFILKLDFMVALQYTISGGLFLGAFFMATDYATTPLNKLGKLVFGIGCGVITVLIRMWGSYPEGVSFAILLMNILSPYIEKLTMKRPHGAIKGGN